MSRLGVEIHRNVYAFVDYYNAILVNLIMQATATEMGGANVVVGPIFCLPMVLLPLNGRYQGTAARRTWL